ncbi:AzlD domain-containing protein [Roseomonas sp. CAU 1739]|uniref:AzlD domain-containing protein n=1 Tax=Roseomonas sp. CAU 1739 TaxID=3140364 RepID=UPI00325BC35F
MPPADLALLVTALACLGLRLAGVLLAGGLSTDHPLIAWATAVAQATLAAFVTLAIVAPNGALAEIPLNARLAGLAVGMVICLTDRRRLLPALLAGLGTMLVMRGLL